MIRIGCTKQRKRQKRLARQYLQDKSHETEEEIDKLAREDKLCKIQKLEDKLHETKKEIDRLAPLVRKFRPDKLRETEEEADRLTRKFLKKIRFNTRTLQLKIESNLSKFTKLYQWFEETYPKIRQDFDEKSNAILRDTEAQLNKVFGSHYHKPIVREIMGPASRSYSSERCLEGDRRLQPNCPKSCKTTFYECAEYSARMYYQNQRQRKQHLKYAPRTYGGLNY